MRSSRVLLLIVAACLAGCGSRPKDRGAHGQSAPPAEAAPPTPDNTPVEALRTPAGLVLKTSETPPPVTPSPSPSPGAEAPRTGS
jgi:hypothetical protein